MSESDEEEKVVQSGGDEQSATKVQACVGPYDKDFICKCGRGFTTLWQLNKHLTPSHESATNKLTTLFHCECDSQFATIAKLKVHSVKRRWKIENLRKCTTCKTLFDTSSQIWKHFGSVHANDVDFLEGVFKCEIPDCSKPKGATTFTSFMNHVKIHHSKPSAAKFKCPICVKVFFCNETLTDHMKQAHPDDILKQDKNTQSNTILHAAVLSASDSTQEELEVAHLEEDPAGAKEKQCVGPYEKDFICKCGKELASLVLLKSHLTTSHQSAIDKLTTMFHCECESQFETISQLREHSVTRKWKIEDLRGCTRCEKYFDTSRQLWEHFRNVHSNDAKFLEGVFKCEIPNCPTPEGATNSTAFKDHVRAFHSKPSETKYKCPICSKGFKVNKELKNHMKQVHPDGILKKKNNHYTCSVGSCTETFNKLAQYEKHTASAHPNVKVPLLTCAICNKSFASKGSASSHMRWNHGITTEADIDLPKCPICHEEVEDLMDHFINYHDGFKKDKLRCIGCGYRPQLKNTLYSHIRIAHHNEERLLKWYFTCRMNECQFFAESASLLQSHKKMEHPQRNEINKMCIYCKEYLSCSQNLMAHYKSKHPTEHAGTHKLLTCPKCNLTFDSLYDRHRHRGKHKNDLVQCDGCDSKVTREYFWRHVKTVHAGQPDILKKYFKCNVRKCKKWFRTRRAYLQHKLSHIRGFKHGDYRCSTCNRFFVNNASKKLHDKYFHQLQNILFRCPKSGCDEVCPTMFQYKQHLKESHGDKENLRMTQCPMCIKTFCNTHSLLGHIRAFHFPTLKKGMFSSMCNFPGCEQYFGTRKSLSHHRAKEHKWIIRMEEVCQICDTYIGNRWKLVAHIDREHGGGESFAQAMLTCKVDGCLDTCPTLKDLRQHRSSHGPMVKFPTVTKSRNRRQIMECDFGDCEVKVQGLKAWLKHRAEHGDILKLHQCRHCFKFFLRKGSLTSHVTRCNGKQIKDRHGRKKCDRPGCPFVAYDTCEMRLHQMVHIRAGDGFHCWKCGMFFATISLLVYHGKHRHGRTDQDSAVSQGSHGFKVNGVYSSDRNDATRDWKYSCSHCHVKRQTKEELLDHVKNSHHSNYKEQGMPEVHMAHSRDETTCMDCSTVFPCTFSHDDHVHKVHPSEGASRWWNRRGLVFTWCSCCQFDSPDRELVQPHPYSSANMTSTQAMPVLLTCQQCQWSTKDHTEAYLHIRDNLDEDYWEEVDHQVVPGTLTAANFDQCRECRLLCITECEYLTHLEIFHYDKYIDMLTTRYPAMEGSAAVMAYRKTGAPLKVFPAKECSVPLMRCDDLVQEAMQKRMAGIQTNPEADKVGKSLKRHGGNDDSSRGSKKRKL